MTSHGSAEVAKFLDQKFLDHCLRYPSAALRPCLAFILSLIPRLGVSARTLDARQSHDSHRVSCLRAPKVSFVPYSGFAAWGEVAGSRVKLSPESLSFANSWGNSQRGPMPTRSLVGITSLSVMSRIEQQSLSEILLFRTKCVPQPRSSTSLTDWIRAGSFGTTTGSDGICGCS